MKSERELLLGRIRFFPNKNPATSQGGYDGGRVVKKTDAISLHHSGLGLFQHSPDGEDKGDTHKEEGGTHHDCQALDGIKTTGELEDNSGHTDHHTPKQSHGDLGVDLPSGHLHGHKEGCRVGGGDGKNNDVK